MESKWQDRGTMKFQDNVQLKLELEEPQLKQRRKKVVPKPNEVFVTMERIEEVIKEVEALETKMKARKPKRSSKMKEYGENVLVLI